MQNHKFTTAHLTVRECNNYVTTVLQVVFAIFRQHFLRSENVTNNNL